MADSLALLDDLLEGLEKYIKKKSSMDKKSRALDDHLKYQVSGEYLRARGILDPVHVAASLQPTACTLEKGLKKMAEMSGSSETTMHKRRLSDAPRLEEATRMLQKSMTRDALDKRMSGRMDADSMLDAGLLYSLKMASSLQRSARDLEQLLATRVGPDYLSKRGLSPSAFKRPLDASLQPAAFELDKFLKHKESSPTMRPRIADTLSGTAKTMDRHMRRRSLQEHLDARVDVETVKDMGVLMSDTLSANLQPTAAELEEELKRRPPASYLKKKHVLMEPSLSVEHQKAAAAIDKGLAVAHDHEDHHQHGEDTKVAPMLAATARVVQTEITKDRIEAHLEHRPSVVDLEHAEIVYSSTMAKSLQATALELERKLESGGDGAHSMSMSRLIDASYFPFMELNASIRGVAVDLEKALATAKHKETAAAIKCAQLRLAPALQECGRHLKRLMEHAKFERMGPPVQTPKADLLDDHLILFDSDKVSDSLHPAAASVKQQLKTRPDEEYLRKKHILQDTRLPVEQQIAAAAVDASLKRRDSSVDAKDAAEAVALESRRKRELDETKGALKSEFARRKSVDQMMDSGLLHYTFEFACSLHRNAQLLEEQLRTRVAEDYLKAKDPTGRRLSDSLAATAYELQRSKAKDAVSKSLRHKHTAEAKDAVSAVSVHTTAALADSLAPAAKVLDMEMKKAKVRTGLDAVAARNDF